MDDLAKARYEEALAVQIIGNEIAKRDATGPYEKAVAILASLAERGLVVARAEDVNPKGP